MRRALAKAMNVVLRRQDPVEVISMLNRGEINYAQARDMMARMRKVKIEKPRGFNNQQLSPDVQNFDIIHPRGAGGRMNVTGFNQTPMIDIDLPRQSHPEMSVTAGTAGDAIDQLRDFAGANTSYLTTFMTKGGIRAFDLSKVERPVKFYGRKLATKTGDPLYSAHSLLRNRYDVRVSGKSMYEGEGLDYVAAPLLELAAPGAKVNPLNRYNVEKFHNNIIKQTLHSSKDRSRPGRARHEIIKDANRLLDSVGGNDADAIVKTMKEGGIF